MILSATRERLSIGDWLPSGPASQQEPRNRDIQRSARLTRFSALAALFTAWCLSRFPATQAPAAHLCPFRLLTSIPCPFCGATRSVLALFRGDLSLALSLNALAVLATATCLLIVVHPQSTLHLTRWLSCSWQRVGRAGEVALVATPIVAMIAFDLVRLSIGFGTELL